MKIRIIRVIRDQFTARSHGVGRFLAFTIRYAPQPRFTRAKGQNRVFHCRCPYRRRAVVQLDMLFLPSLSPEGRISHVGEQRSRSRRRCVIYAVFNLGVFHLDGESCPDVSFALQAKIAPGFIHFHPHFSRKNFTVFPVEGREESS